MQRPSCVTGSPTQFTNICQLDTTTVVYLQPLLLFRLLYAPYHERPRYSPLLFHRKSPLSTFGSSYSDFVTHIAFSGKNLGSYRGKCITYARRIVECIPKILKLVEVAFTELRRGGTFRGIESPRPSQLVRAAANP